MLPLASHLRSSLKRLSNVTTHDHFIDLCRRADDRTTSYLLSIVTPLKESTELIVLFAKELDIYRGHKAQGALLEYLRCATFFPITIKICLYSNTFDGFTALHITLLKTNVSDRIEVEKPQWKLSALEETGKLILEKKLNKQRTAIIMIKIDT